MGVVGLTSPNLEVREEILGTQMDDEGSEGPWLVEGIVDEETPCRREDREALAPPLQGWGGGVGGLMSARDTRSTGTL